jgi:hypothetical protein
MDQLREWNVEPRAIVGQFGRDIEALLSQVKGHDSSFVICDHKLQPKGFASFYGADVVKRLIHERRPAMLLTMYQSTQRLELRASRHELPVVMGRDVFRPEAVKEYFEICDREIAADPIDERKPHRALIRVDDVRSSNKHIDVVIPSWSPERAITIPSECIDPKIISQVRPGTYLLGDVNIGAQSEDDLFFVNLDEIVPHPSDEWL